MKAVMKKYKMLAVVAAVIIIPLVYSYMYLYAFWDPYSRLDELPVAIVSEDLGGLVNGEQKNVGSDILNELKDNDAVKWQFVSSEEAQRGLEGESYYASVTIPANFTKEIAKADSPERVKGLVIYKMNEKRNFLAGQVMNRVAVELEGTISRSISEEIVKAMTDGIAELPDQLGELNDGLGEMKDGTTTLYDKTGDLVKGQTAFNKGVATLSTGLTEASKGTQTLKNGTWALAAGTTEFAEALKSGASKTPALVDGAKGVEKGAVSLSENLNQYVGGVNQFATGVNQSLSASAAVGSSLKAYLASHPEAMKDANMQAVLKTLEAGKPGSVQLAEAAEKLKTSGEALSAGSKQLADGSQSLAVGVEQVGTSLTVAAEKAQSLKNGATAIDQGVSQLETGIVKAANGSELLSENAEKLLAGESKLRNGIKTLDEGVGEAKTEVDQSVVDAKDKVDSLEGIDTYAADPIDFENDKINPIPDYGTAFTPYFVSLSLWVGALMMFFAIYLDSTVRFRRSNSNSKGFVRFLAYTGIGVSQAVVLAFVLRTALHLEVKNVSLFYMTCIAISLAFVSIMRFLLVHIGDVGKFFAVLMLILQLTACGGTFPMELVPKFFQDINPYMPMTYSVNVLKEVISGIDYSIYNYNLAVLFGIAIVFLGINVGLAQLRRKKNPEMDPIF